MSGHRAGGGADAAAPARAARAPPARAAGAAGAVPRPGAPHRARAADRGRRRRSPAARRRGPGARRGAAHRVLRAVKNRFGSTNELGVFEMTGAGLVGVPDPSEVFGRTVPGEPGAAVACALEGTRPILLEIQALVAQSELAMPRRVATGIDPKRLAMIVAGLSRHARVPPGQADGFVNVAGGVRPDEPGADLAVALAIASAARRVPVKSGVAAFGEIGLTGRLRPAAQAERRLEECAKLGLSAVVAPTGTALNGKIAVEAAETLRQAIRAGLDGDRSEGDDD